jgi:hypothetical protein
MTVTGSYDKHASHRNVDAEIERLAAQARLGWAKKRARCRGSVSPGFRNYTER